MSTCGDSVILGGATKENKPVVIEGKKYKMMYGSRRQVYNGTAYKTKGNLKQNDIIKNKQGRFVSAKKSKMATEEQRLLKYGYGAQKGKFGFVRVKPRTMKSASPRVSSDYLPVASGFTKNKKRRTKRTKRRKRTRRRRQ